MGRVRLPRGPRPGGTSGRRSRSRGWSPQRALVPPAGSRKRPGTRRTPRVPRGTCAQPRGLARGRVEPATQRTSVGALEPDPVAYGRSTFHVEQVDLGRPDSSRGAASRLRSPRGGNDGTVGPSPQSSGARDTCGVPGGGSRQRWSWSSAVSVTTVASGHRRGHACAVIPNPGVATSVVARSASGRGRTADPRDGARPGTFASFPAAAARAPRASRRPASVGPGSDPTDRARPFRSPVDEPPAGDAWLRRERPSGANGGADPRRLAPHGVPPAGDRGVHSQRRLRRVGSGRSPTGRWPTWPGYGEPSRTGHPSDRADRAVRRLSAEARGWLVPACSRLGRSPSDRVRGRPRGWPRSHDHATFHVERVARRSASNVLPPVSGFHVERCPGRRLLSGAWTERVS
jgi:hypothetical protein